MLNGKVLQLLTLAPGGILRTLHIGQLGELPLDHVRVVAVGDLQKSCEPSSGFGRKDSVQERHLCRQGVRLPDNRKRQLLRENRVNVVNVCDERAGHRDVR